MQKGLTVKVCLNSSTIFLVISSEFARWQGFKLKKIKRLIYMRDINGIFNKERSIENTVEVNIFYKGYREKIEIYIIGEQK